MTNPIPYLLQGKNIILVIDGQSHTVSRQTHMCYDKIVTALKDKAWDELRDLVSPAKAIEAYGSGNITIEDGELFWKGRPFHNALANRLLQMFQEGLPIEPMIAFMENLMENPSYRSIEQTYSFLERNSLPITEDGYFLAFKKVRKGDYKDIHSGTIRNAIGDVVEMDRNGVDDNPNSTCSAGLHFCSESYLNHFGSHNDPVMILKIHPKDVVSIPTDYNGAKGRCCKYTVVAEVKGNPAEAFARVVVGDYDTPADPVVEEVTDREVIEGMYDLVRVSNGMVEYENLEYDEALDIIDRHARQKKAKLKIVEAGTDNEV